MGVNGFKFSSLFLLLLHPDRLLRALVGTDAAALAELVVDLQVLIDRCLGAVELAEPALIALLRVNHRLEGPPGPGLPRRPLRGL